MFLHSVASNSREYDIGHTISSYLWLYSWVVCVLCRVYYYSVVRQANPGCLDTMPLHVKRLWPGPLLSPVTDCRFNSTHRIRLVTTDLNWWYKSAAEIRRSRETACLGCGYSGWTKIACWRYGLWIPKIIFSVAVRCVGCQDDSPGSAPQETVTLRFKHHISGEWLQ